MAFTRWFGLPKGGKPSKCHGKHRATPCSCAKRFGASPSPLAELSAALKAAGWTDVEYNGDKR